MGLDVVLSAVFVEFVTIKLATIIHYEGVCDSKPRGDILMDECLYIPFSDGGKSFCFSPLGKVVDSNNYVVTLTLCWRRERSE